MEKTFILINTHTYMKEQCNQDTYSLIPMVVHSLKENGFTDEEIEDIDRMNVDDVWRDEDYDGVIVVRVM